MAYQVVTIPDFRSKSHVDIAVMAKDISKHYGKFKALTDIHFDLQAGQTLALLGHNGAGKSTLLKLILGLIRPSTGQILVQGQDVSAKQAKGRLSIGYLPENVSFYDNMTAIELLGYFAKLKGVHPGMVRQLLLEFGLDEAKDKRLSTFSKGMRQRLALAQAILAKPKVLLLDEPTVGLDPIASGFLYQKMAQLKAQGCAIMVCTHELALVQDQMDRALILGQGKMLASGNLTALRAATALPLQIRLPSLSTAQRQQLLSDEFLSPFVIDSTLQGVRLNVPVAAKSAVITQLQRGIHTDEFSVEMPNLQDIFHCYMAKLPNVSAAMSADSLNPLNCERERVA